MTAPSVQRLLAELAQGHDLSRVNAHALFGAIMSGDATPAQIGAALAALFISTPTTSAGGGAAIAVRTHRRSWPPPSRGRLSRRR